MVAFFLRVNKMHSVERGKINIVLTLKSVHMQVFFLPQETLFLEFQLQNGSGWLTSHRARQLGLITYY